MFPFLSSCVVQAVYSLMKTVNPSFTTPFSFSFDFSLTTEINQIKWWSQYNTRLTHFLNFNFVPVVSLTWKFQWEMNFVCLSSVDYNCIPTKNDKNAQSRGCMLQIQLAWSVPWKNPQPINVHVTLSIDKDIHMVVSFCRRKQTQLKEPWEKIVMIRDINLSGICLLSIIFSLASDDLSRVVIGP